MRGGDIYEPGEFRQIEARLLPQFSPPLPAEEVTRCLFECIGTFEGARVRTYLSVLIERAARERLREAVRGVEVPQLDTEVLRVAPELSATSSGAGRLVAAGTSLAVATATRSEGGSA